MVNAKRTDVVGASVALGEFRRAATRMTASIRDTALVVTALLWYAGFQGLDGPMPPWSKRELKIVAKYPAPHRAKFAVGRY